MLAIALIAAEAAGLLQAAGTQEVGTWEAGNASPAALLRAGAATTSLANGATLIAGGQLPDGTVTGDISVYDPQTEAVVSVGHLSTARVNASAALLADGRVVVSGGESGGIINADLEIFDPATGTSAPVALMAKPRTRHASARLGDGHILLVGGASVDAPAVADAEIFDPATNTTVAASNTMATPRAGASATTLIDGRVLVIGGNNGAQDLATAEIYYQGSGFFATDTSLSVARSGHSAALLPDNASVLVIGGTAAGAPVATTDIFLPSLFPDPYTWSMGAFAAAAPLNAARTGATSGPGDSEGFAFAAGGGVQAGERYRFSTIKTDKGDYPPGQLAVITGTGWQPGETVRLTFQEDPAVHADYVRDIVADSDGNISLTDWAPEPHDANVRFYLMAMGQSSARRAQMTFTDSVSSVTITSPTAAAPITVAQGDSFTVSFTYDTGSTGTTTATAFLCKAPANSCNQPNQIVSATKTVASGANKSDSITLTVPAGTTIASDYRVQVDVENSDGSGANQKSDGQNSAVNVIAAKLVSNVATTIHNGSHGAVTSVALGSTVHDSVSVTGSGATPTGTVTLSFFAGSACSAPATATSSALTLSGGALDATAFARGPLAAGTYSFQANYSGDTTYKAATGACEPLTVTKAQLSISTQLHDASHGNVGGNTHAPLGSVVHDTATVTGAVSGFPIPAVTFTKDGGPFDTAASAESGFTASSVSTAALGAGSYTFTAVVAGDSNYLGATSADEPLVVDKAQLTITTQIHNAAHGNVGDATHVSLGAIVHDTATVAGAVSGFPLPSISFTLNGGAFASAASTESGFTASSVDTTALAAGSYTFKAAVAGDNNYIGATSTDEPLTVDKAQLGISTRLHNASHGTVGGAVHVPLGSIVHDTATVTGGVSGFPIPAVTFNKDGGAFGTAAQAESGFTASSVDTAALAAGSYVFKASVDGDSNYLGATSADEPLTVDKAQLAISTLLHNAAHGTVGGAVHVSLGAIVHDTATVTGAVSGFPIPAVTFTKDGGALATAASTESGFTAASVDTAALAAGNYVFKASVEDNPNYLGATSADEPLTVDKATLTITSQIHNAAHTNVGDTVHVTLGAVVHDTAKVTGGVAGFPVPAISFTFDAVAIANAASTEAGFDASSVATSALAAGLHNFVATVASDSNYVGGNSGNEPITVDKQPTTVVASSPTDTPQYSDKARLRAVVTPAEVPPFQLTGTVYFYVGAAAVNCSTVNTNTAVGSDPVLDADNGVAEVSYQLLTSAGAYAAGSYKVTACFVDNSGNFGNSGDDEVLAIGKEDATFVNLSYPTSIPVSTTSFTLSAAVQELRNSGVEPDTNDGALPGDISKVTALTAKIVGIASGAQYTGSCDAGSGGSTDYASTRAFTCTFNSGGAFAVDAYTLTLDIPSTNTYWQALTYEDALSVWDPNAGFATGGGTFSLGGDRVSFGFSYTLQKGKTVPRSGFVVVRHMAGGGVCRVKSNNQMNAPAVNGVTVTLSGKGNYSCTDATGNTTASQGNINLAAYAEDNSTSGIGFDKFWVSNGASVAPNYLVMPTPAGTNAALLTGGNVQVPQPGRK